MSNQTLKHTGYETGGRTPKESEGTARPDARQERGRRTKLVIVEGAALAFERQGFSAATLAEIESLSGISQGAIYFHYKTKEKIALAVMQEQHDRTYAHVEKALPSTSDPLEQIMQVSRVVCDLLSTDAVVRAGISLALEQGTLQEKSTESYDTWTRGIAFLLRKAVAREFIRPVLPIEKLARELVGNFTGVQMMAQTTSDRSSLLEDVTAMWQVFIAAVSNPDHQERYQHATRELFTPSEAHHPVSQTQSEAEE